jgi:hypothetical protein
MSQKLINLNPDLRQLRDEGYEVEVRGGYLVIHHIPYVNSRSQVAYGTLVSILCQNGTQVLPPDNHVIYFIGDHPCNKDGSLISAISYYSRPEQFLPGLTVQHAFSNRPPAGYPNYYEKVKRYVEIITAPARSLDASVTPFTFKIPPDADEERVFRYPDTNTSRAKIDVVNQKLAGQQIGIIGLGGTGAYVLDLVAKTPVAGIHLFDGDLFLQHNAFRSPGAASFEELEALSKKVDYYYGIYNRMHSGVHAHGYYLHEGNLSELEKLSFVFICVDKNSVRKLLISYLLSKDIPFIDCGMGIELLEDSLIGTVRMTLGTPTKNDHLASRVPTIDREDEVYQSNIQIADLNALNATFAVLKWKKMNGFYQDLIRYHNSIYAINAAQLSTSDIAI